MRARRYECGYAFSRSSLSPSRPSRRGALLAFEGRLEVRELSVGYADRSTFLAPACDCTFHLAENLFGARATHSKVAVYPEETIDCGLRPSFVRYLSLELAGTPGRRVEIERRRQAPLTARDVQKAMIEEMVVDIRDQDRERKASP